jgi:CRP-like cAMP-binding protein
MITWLETFNSICPVSWTLRDAIEENIIRREYREGEIVLESGDICNCIWFVEDGLLWQYYAKEDLTVSGPYSKKDKYWRDNTVTTTFLSPGDLCTCSDSFFTRESGNEYIQAIRICRLCAISFETYQGLTAAYPEFNNLCRILWERCTRRRDERLRNLILRSTEEKFRWFQKHYPDLVDKVKLRHIASYLGVSESMLSKLK